MPLSAQLARLLAKGISKAGRGTIPDTTMSPTRLQAQKITPNVPSAIASDVRTDVVDTPISVSDEFSAPVVKEVEPETSEELRAIGEELRVIRKKVEQTPAFYATMTTGELEEQVKLSKAKENEDMIIALGSQERVNRFNKLDRQMNSSNIKLSDEASEKFDIEFGDLTDEQDILIYGRKGVGPPTADEFKALFEARRVIEDLEDREYSPDSEVARVLIHGLLDFDLTPKKIRSLLIKKQGDIRTQEGSTYVLGAFQEAKNRGIDLEDELIRSMERRGFSEPEAYEMLNPFLTYTKEQRPQLKEFVSPSVFDATRSRKEAQKIGGYWTDNPKGEWLKEKREYAAEKMKQNPISGIGRGTQTAGIGGASGKAEMRTSFLKDLPGARGEEAYRTSSPQAKKLKEKVKVGGWKPDPIMVWVNYDGKVYIAEGNHRVALAVERGEEFLPVDIRYFAGSEEVEGLFNPKTLEKNKALRLTEAEDPIKEEMDKLVPSAGGRGRGKGGGDGIDEDTAPLEEIEKFYKLPENQRQAQTPELKEAAQALQRKEITKQEFDEIADTFYPAKLITEMPEPPHARRIEAVLRTKVKSRPVVNETISKQLEIQSKEGKRFGTRLDIPAYNIYDTWVVTVHGPGRTGKALHYSKTAYLTDVIFMSDPDKALKVATGDTSKQSFARMEGQWKDMKPDDVYDLAAEELNKPNSEWVQIGMNPYKHSYFYDKKTMQPILSADEVIQVGPLVLARNVKRGKASDFVFNKGGVVDMRNGGRVGAAVVAASLMANGGQAIDMRNGGVVRMQEGGMTTLIPLQSGATPPIPKEKPYIPEEVFVQAVLNVIAEGEGTGDQGYNIVFGTPRGGSSSRFINPTTELTNMTLKELDTFQRKLVNATRDKVEGVPKGYGTSAVGKYQITMPVITDAVNAGIVNRKERFTPEVQERIARFLLNRSGLESMLFGKMSPKEYRKKLSKVWASIEGSKAGQPIKTSAKKLENLFTVATNNLLPQFKSK